MGKSTLTWCGGREVERPLLSVEGWDGKEYPTVMSMGRVCGGREVGRTTVEGVGCRKVHSCHWGGCVEGGRW